MTTAGRLSDKVILVTGAASGIGAACAEVFAAEGASVLICDVNEQGGIAVANRLGERTTFLKLDTSNESDWITCFESTLAQFGGVHGVANVAGIARTDDNIEACTPREWSQMLRVNLDGVFLGTKHGVLAMKRGGGGSIVNISSIYALVSDPFGEAISYTASKGGVRLLSKSAALHCAREGYAIRVNTVHPGFIDTPMGTMSLKSDADPKAEIQATIDRHPVGRLGRAEEIAMTALYLLSDESAFVTGTEMFVDGGYSAV